MSEIKTKIKVSVERAEIRKGKIIIVLNPDVLSGDEFFINPFIKQSSVREVGFNVNIKEKDGVLKVVSNYNNESNYTTNHRQISSMPAYCTNRKDSARNWLAKNKNIEAGKFKELLEQFPEEYFKRELILQLSQYHKEKRLIEYSKAIRNFEDASEKLKDIMTEEMSSNLDQNVNDFLKQ